MHGEGRSAPRQKAARKALAATPRRKFGGTFSPEPPPLGGGSSRSRARQARASTAFDRRIGRQIDRAQAATVDHGVEHIAPHRVRIGRKSINGITVDPGQVYRTDSLGVPQGTPASGFSRIAKGLGHSLLHGDLTAKTVLDLQLGQIPSRADVHHDVQMFGPSSVTDIEHGQAPSLRHLGEDALFFAPWSRGLRATGEAIKAAAEAEKGARAAEAVGKAAESYKAGQGVGGAALRGANRLLPSERALSKNVARQKLHSILDQQLPRDKAQATKRLIDQSAKAMVRNGHAHSVTDAIGKLIDTHFEKAPLEAKVGAGHTTLHQALRKGLSEKSVAERAAEITRQRVFDHFDRTLGKAQAAAHKHVFDDAVKNAVKDGERVEEATQRLAAVHASLANEVSEKGIVHPGDLPSPTTLHQDYVPPPSSAGEVALRKAAEGGVPIKGAFELTNEGRNAILHLTQHMDVTTVPHELGHFLEHFGLSPEDKAVVEQWAGPLDNVDAHEKFAQGLEAYIRSGEAPNNLKAEFKVLQPAFHAAYPSVGQLPQLSPAVADVYKKLLGHRDGLPAAVYFALRNKTAAYSLKQAALRGPDRDEQQTQDYLQQLNDQARAEGFGTPSGVKPVDLRAGETTEETGGALGALVRAGLADPSGLKAAGTYEKVGATLDNAPRTIGQMETQQEEARGIARSMKAGSLNAAQQDALTADNPYEAFMAAGAARKGMLPKSDFKGFDQLEPHLNDLTLFVGRHPNLRPFERQRLMEAITRGITENRMPAKNERRLIAKTFGREATKGFTNAIRRGEITLADILNIPRAAMSSGDLSAGLRQGLAALFYKPNIFFDGWTDQLKFAFSEGRYEEAMRMIEESPNYALMNKGNVTFTDIGEDLNAREEHFGSQLAEQLPVVGRFIRGSDRAYTGFLNVLRAHLFDYMVRDAAGKGWNLDEHALESIGSVVNALTGRGNLPEALAEHRAFLNGMFFSPGLAFSRLNFLGFGGSKGWKMLLPGSWYVSLHPYARREAMKTLMRLTGGLSTILWFAHMAGASVSLDPRNADFGKIRIGNTRFDVAGGFQQWVRLISELATGQIVSSTTGRVEHLGGGFAQETRLDAALQFLEGKAAPVPSMIIDLLRGTGFGNQPVSVQNELSQHMIPLAWHDIWDIARSNSAGGGPKMAAFATIPDLLGVGVQNYTGPGPQTHKNTLTLEEQSKQAGLGSPPQSVLDDVKWKSELDAATYAGQKPIDKAKAVIGLFDKRYGTNLEQQVLPQIHTEGQAEALYQALRAKLFPSLEHWQSAINKVLGAQKGSEPVPAQQKSSAPAPAVTPPQAPPMQEAAYHIPTHSVAGAQHTQGLPPELSSAIDKAAAKYGVPAKTLAGIWRIESGSTYPNPAVNSSGYGGLFGTTKWNASTREQADYAAQTLRHLLDTHNGNMAAALSAYSGGGYTSVPGAGGAVHQGPQEATGAVLRPSGGFGVGGAPSGGNALTLSVEQGLQMLASGQYNPTQFLLSLSSAPLSNTIETPGGLHVKFQIPKLSGRVGKAARGAIALAEAYLGTPYVWGGESPKGFDCSGLLQYIYAAQGVQIPRISQDQWQAGAPVPKSRLQPGDAVFFVGSDGSRSAPGHVGIYIGHGKFIEAPHTGATVRISNLAGYPGYVGARRYANPRRKAA